MKCSVLFTFSNSPYLFFECVLCIVTDSCEETKHSYSLTDRQVEDFYTDNEGKVGLLFK